MCPCLSKHPLLHSNLQQHRFVSLATLQHDETFEPELKPSGEKPANDWPFGCGTRLRSIILACGAGKQRLLFSDIPDQPLKDQPPLRLSFSCLCW